ncbi:MAG: hypothetical protein P8Y71_20690 [Pseudolabrys sp.]|jgi:hypothetical protein
MSSKEPDRAAQPGSPASELEITPAMIDAGGETILVCVGGANLGGYFSAPQLAAQVYRAVAN